MAGIIGQITYNVDYINNDNQISKEILMTGIIGEEAKGCPIPEGNIITKLGIQAQPGTKVILGLGNNSEVPIIIGRSGIYELDDRISITQLKIEPTPIYKFDEEATRAAQDAALEQFNQIEDQPLNVDKKNTEPGWGNEQEKVKKWVESYQKNNSTFNEGYPKYLQGLYGIYTPITEKDEEGKETPKTEDIYNLIIDYIYQNNSEI